ncbi:MAG: ankyrin repeat domain-containing protein [Campylobacteraceae bacterium]|nr:ankyrin repeat domain-containing protein [Campylobacteraceae bacterium]
MLKKIFNKNKPSKEGFNNALFNKIFNLDELEFNYTENINLFETNEKYETLLHLCAKSAYLESIKWLLEKKLSLEALNEDKETVLFYAVRSNNLSVVKFLVENGANVNHKNFYNRTALQEAIISGSKTYKYLLSKTDDIKNKDFYGNNLLFDAVANGSSEILDAVLKNEKVDINCVNKNRNTILHKESVYNNYELTSKLLENGANPTLGDKDGKNFLFYAINKGIENIKIIEKAIEFGCEVNTKDFLENTILNYAVENHLKAKEKHHTIESCTHFKLIEKLINFDINVNSLNKDEETVLFQVIRSNDEELIKYFLSLNKFNINQKNNLGETLLTEACYKGFKNIELIKTLIDLGADVNIRDNNDSTVIEKLIDLILHYKNQKIISYSLQEKSSYENNYYDLLEYLLKNTKVDLKKYNSKAQPLFFDVIIYYNFEVFKLLKKYGININQKNLEHKNILFYLIENADSSTSQKQKLYLKTLQSLLNLGVNINEKDDLGATALHKAILNNCMYTIKLLLEAKPNFSNVDNKGRTIVHNIVWKDCCKTFKLVNSYDQKVVNIADNYGVLPINYAVFMGKYDLVITMIDEYAHINNTNLIDPKMITFFKKFHNNLKDLIKYSKSKVDEKNLKLLSENMKKEFLIQ